MSLTKEGVVFIPTNHFVSQLELRRFDLSPIAILSELIELNPDEVSFEVQSERSTIVAKRNSNGNDWNLITGWVGRRRKS